MNYEKPVRRIVRAALILTLLIGCSSPTSTPTPAPTPSHTPSATATPSPTTISAPALTPTVPATGPGVDEPSTSVFDNTPSAVIEMREGGVSFNGHYVKMPCERSEFEAILGQPTRIEALANNILVWDDYGVYIYERPDSGLVIEVDVALGPQDFAFYPDALYVGSIVAGTATITGQTDQVYLRRQGFEQMYGIGPWDMSFGAGTVHVSFNTSTGEVQSTSLYFTTATADASPTATPAGPLEIELEDYPGLPLEEDPLSEYYGMPVMPEATAGQEYDLGHGPFYFYSIEAEPEAIVSYYEQEVTGLGWEMECFDGFGFTCFFTRVKERCHFILYAGPYDTMTYVQILCAAAFDQ